MPSYIKINQPQTSQENKARNWSVNTSLGVNYKIVESKDLFAIENRNLLFLDGKPSKLPIRRLVVIDEKVYSLYREPIHEYFDAHAVELRILPLPISEPEKNWGAVERILEELDAFKILRRDEPLIAIGGGVLLDIAGLAANLYRRGIPYIRVPTNLLALVDASVGAKTGVNFQGYRNRIGTYYPPLVAFLDKTFLRTVDTRQICNGLGEILKIGLVKDRELFELLEKHGDLLVTKRFQGPGVPDLVIQRAIQGMVEELEPNLWEKQLERLVDFGHSFSPVIEMRALPELLHGEAVALDLAFSSVLAFQRGLLNSLDLDRVFKTMKILRLPTTHPLFCKPALLYEALEETVKHRNGLQRLPLPTGIGSARFFNDVTFEEIEMAASTLKQR
ncbi:sedoheptulose 7-phosphate cyclase [Tolypothrix sp. NIES-4075]|uniref:sedoheptulose 7-phosphate cyclase n=1 Tax=Tolypothrix sp. NIES-4075 TaxID=2005459 RepID=UPI00190EB885|nr:sedoheptulose 7-phosphate cyclase [Tolypothrix sp. NIES-4075]